ncbi:hypothetical protein JXA88_15080 [Candidatus Fermentibacteria bacterium]|nr:hypothetical protein [Candidatus Fermentibacteria bacterium]
MSRQLSLQEAERRAFTTAYEDGLWDVLLGCFLLLFAVAPPLSRSLGDFWSSAVFLPFWGLVYALIRWLRTNMVAPRIGTVRFGRARRTRLALFSRAMLVINLAALILGLLVATGVGRVPGSVIPILFGLLLLIGFNLAAVLLGISRLHLYGLLVGLSPLVGEWLYTHRSATHHGFPVTFGTSAAVAIIIGVGIFIRVLRSQPISECGTSSEDT